MQIEKARLNGRLHVSKVSWKFQIPTAHNFAVILHEMCNFPKEAETF